MVTLIRLSNLYLTNPVLAAGLPQALGIIAGIFNAVGLVACFGGLIGALVAALSERHLGSVTTNLVIAGVGGIAWIVAQALFAAGGQPPNIEMQPIA
jgi:hypothetical protein